jgi:predicted ATPase
MNSPRLQSFRLRNFKAVQDSGTITFTPLTVFIGNNGSGKSSILEGLEMLYTLITSDLDSAIAPWRDFRYILNQAVPHEPKTKTVPRERPYSANPMNFELRGQLEDKINDIYTLNVTDTPNGDELFIKQEILRQTGRNVPFINFKRDDTGLVTGKYVIDTEEETIETKLQEGISLLNLSPSPFAYDLPLRTFIRNWQFVSLVPQKMGEPRRQRRATSQILLEKDGSNVAEYLLDIQKRDRDAFDSIVSTLQQILPYSQDLQMALTSELDRSIYPQLTEGNFKVPGWLLSTGTLRILALLALLRHPEPPPLIIIEEIENGLDPQSVRLIINEMREAISAGKTQIIMTTHSPFLLDLVSLDHIVLVERIDGKPLFSRPGDNEKLQQWAESFSLGTLYTAGRLGRQRAG